MSRGSIHDRDKRSSLLRTVRIDFVAPLTSLPRGAFPGIKRPECLVDHSPPFTVALENECSKTFASPDAFVASTGATVTFPLNSACRSKYQILIFMKSPIIISNLTAVNFRKLTFSCKVVSCWNGYAITAITFMYLDHASIEA
jgi:hypothetical protein